jgi:hypothetical protein
MSQDGVGGLVLKELHNLRERLAAMEKSKFWRLRQIWFRLRRLLGLARAE